MICIDPYFFQIIMFTTYAQTFLCIRNAGIGCLFISQKIILELIHPRVGEHQRWVILYNNWSGWNYLVPFGFKKLQKLLSNLLACLHNHNTVFSYYSV